MFLMGAATVNAAESARIEGHVFNLTSGVPLENVSIELCYLQDDLIACLLRDVTDANGFYSFEVGAGQERIRIDATCNNGRTIVEGMMRLPSEVRPGETIQRDAYLPASRKRSFHRCEE